MLDNIRMYKVWKCRLCGDFYEARAGDPNEWYLATRDTELTVVHECYDFNDYNGQFTEQRGVADFVGVRKVIEGVS
jgi:rubredoxin